MSPRLAAHAAALLVACGSLWTALHHGRWGLDDAYISYRYANNWIAGHGLVFNPGEAVEGYTNFLYIVLVAPGLALFGADAVYAWSVGLNVLLLVAAIYAVHAAATARVGALAFIPTLLCAASPGLWVACWSGLETPLVFALFAAAWAALVRIDATPVGFRAKPAIVLAVLLAGLVLARADGFVMASIFVGYVARDALRKREVRTFALCAGAAAGTALVHVAARLAYYGHPLPNSYYAKVSGDLVDRVAFAWKIFPDLWPVLPFIVVLALAAPHAWAASNRRTNTASRVHPTLLAALMRFSPPFEVGFPIAWLAYWFYVGGDVFHERFLLVLIPLGATLFVEQGRRITPVLLRRAGAVAGIAALLVLPWHDTDLVAERTQADRFIDLGRFLGERNPGAVLAADAAGKLPFFSGLATIDMYGLTDATIARGPGSFEVPGHSKSDPAYVLGRRPDLIAGWLDPATMTVNPGLGRNAYTRAGYRLSLLVYTPKGNPAQDRSSEPILEAGGLSPEQVRAYWARDYRYAVLERDGRNERNRDLQ